LLDLWSIADFIFSRDIWGDQEHFTGTYETAWRRMPSPPQRIAFAAVLSAQACAPLLLRRFEEARPPKISPERIEQRRDWPTRRAATQTLPS